MRHSVIHSIEFHLPETVLTNAQLSEQFPEWGVDKIAAKTGILTRHIAAPGELSSDLAYRAAMKLFAAGACRPEEVDYLLLCTQTPDHLFPTTACLLQHRLGLPVTCGALDFNLGCSGFVYGLSLAKGLVESGQARKVLLLTAETYSKLLDPSDKSVRTIFGDGAAATLVVEDEASAESIGPFVFGTDGSGGGNLICTLGSLRANEQKPVFMDGPEIFNFTIQAVPAAVAEVMRRDGCSLDDVDLFVFHQANSYMLEHLRKRIGIPAEKFVVAMKDSGNTVSATIPIALKVAQLDVRLRRGMKVMVVGFGVGYSWAAAMIKWR